MPIQRLFSLGLVLLFLATLVYFPAIANRSNLLFSLSIGLALGFCFQRSRFCFYCHARDWFEQKDPRGLLAILLAIAIGLVGYTVLLSSWVATPDVNYLPADIHIGPVSWVLLLSGCSFAAGMVISGSCISGHWYRLAEGSGIALFALLGAVAGFILGFKSWNALYLQTLSTAPVIWLPAYLGYAGALLLQLSLLAVIMLWLWRGFAQEKFVQEKVRANQNINKPIAPPDLWQVWGSLWQGRWPYWVGGLAVGLLSLLVVIRVNPLGVTAPLSGIARYAGAEWLPPLLQGLENFSGCASLVNESFWVPNSLLLFGFIGGAFIASLASQQFQFVRPRISGMLRGLLGGCLLGFGAMLGLGCTVGTLLSGTQAGALSGWVFGAALFMALWLGFQVKKWFRW